MGDRALAPGRGTLALARIAWRNLWRQRRRSLITASAMAFGVAMCMATVAVSDGMYSRIFASLVEQRLGHAQVHQADYLASRELTDTLSAGAALAKELEALPEVRAATPRLFSFALMTDGDRSAGGELRGIDPQAEARVTQLDERLSAGRYLRGAGEIVLGKKLARTLGASVGDALTVVVQTASGSPGEARYTLVGIAETGAAQVDRRGAFVQLTDLQALLGLQEGVHEIALVAPDRGEIPALMEASRAVLGDRDARIRPWSEVDPSAAQMMATQDSMMLIILAVVFTVAGLGVLNTMLMSVFERTHELGVLGALGMTPGQIMAQILWESVFLSTLAAAIGLAAGGAIDAWLVLHGWDLSGFTDGFTTLGVYFDPIYRGEFRADRLGTIVGSLCAISILASVWPAWRAARLDPVVAMRER